MISDEEDDYIEQELIDNQVRLINYKEQINQITKILSDKLSGTEFQNYVINVQSASKQNPTQRQGANTYTGGL